MEVQDYDVQSPSALAYALYWRSSSRSVGSNPRSISQPAVYLPHSILKPEGRECGLPSDNILADLA